MQYDIHVKLPFPLRCLYIAMLSNRYERTIIQYDDDIFLEIVYHWDSGPSRKIQYAFKITKSGLKWMGSA